MRYDQLVYGGEQLATRLGLQDVPALDSRGLEAAIGFFKDRLWFSRKWIIQEVTLAPKVEVLIGVYKLPWDDIGISNLDRRTFMDTPESPWL